MTSSLARSATSHPQFLTLNGRRLFALRIEPVGPCRGSVLYLPPFAEEMNRCRSHVAAQARALAGIGLRTLLVDPYGTGESDGNITDAHWALWRADALAAAHWLLALEAQPLTLWGLRTGALMAADLASALAADAEMATPGLLLWQPVVDGKLFLNQYLRLRIASQMVSGSDRETTEQIRARLACGEVVEVAGYPLSGAMADSLEAQRLGGYALPPGIPVAWLEVVAKAEQPIGPASRRVIDTLVTAGAQLRSATVACPMVWQVHERVDAPQLLSATLGLLQAEGGLSEPAWPASGRPGLPTNPQATQHEGAVP